MFSVIQAIICTFMLVTLVSESVTENCPAPCHIKETHERMRISSPFNSEIFKKEGNSTERRLSILINVLNSEQKEKEGGCSDNESPKEKVTVLIKMIYNPANFTKEENWREKISSKFNLTNSGREKELQNANLTDSAQIIMKYWNSETKNEDRIWIEVESFIENLNKSSICESKKEGNLTENNSLKANLTDFVQIAVNSSETEKENSTDSEQIEKLKEKESTLKNLTISAQKSSLSGKSKKVKRRASADRLRLNEKDEVGRAFLTAYENCEVLKGKHFIRVSGPTNAKETTKCVLRELRKLETYPNEFIKYLENEEIVRKA